MSLRSALFPFRRYIFDILKLANSSNELNSSVSKVKKSENWNNPKNLFQLSPIHRKSKFKVNKDWNRNLSMFLILGFYNTDDSDQLQLYYQIGRERKTFLPDD